MLLPKQSPASIRPCCGILKVGRLDLTLTLNFCIHAVFFFLILDLDLDLLARHLLLVILIWDRCSGAISILRLAHSLLGSSSSITLVAVDGLATALLAGGVCGNIGRRVRSGVFLELTEGGLGGAEGAALGKDEIGPVGVRVGVFDDGDK